MNTALLLTELKKYNIYPMSCTRQCLARRIEDISILQEELSAWEKERNNEGSKIQWHFQTGDAREKLISLYPVYITADQ